MDKYGARMRMETAPEKIQRLLVFSSGDEIFEGEAGWEGGTGDLRGGTAFYRGGKSGPVVEYFQWAKGFPDGFFKVGAPGGREPAEEKFVGEMDGEPAGYRKRERQRGQPGRGGLFGKSGREHFLQTLGIRGEGSLSSGCSPEAVSSCFHRFLAFSHSKNRAAANEGAKFGSFLKTYCYHKGKYADNRSFPLLRTHCRA